MREYSDCEKRLNYDFYGTSKKRYSIITKRIIRKFKLVPIKSKEETFDMIFQEFESGNKLITLEWCWHDGYIVRSKNTDSDFFVKKIAEFIKTKYE